MINFLIRWSYVYALLFVAMRDRPWWAQFALAAPLFVCIITAFVPRRSWFSDREPQGWKGWKQ